MNKFDARGTYIRLGNISEKYGVKFNVTEDEIEAIVDSYGIGPVEWDIEDVDGELSYTRAGVKDERLTVQLIDINKDCDISNIEFVPWGINREKVEADDRAVYKTDYKPAKIKLTREGVSRVFDSKSDAARYLNIRRATGISGALKRPRPVFKGYVVEVLFEC